MDNLFGRAFEPSPLPGSIEVSDVEHVECRTCLAQNMQDVEHVECKPCLTQNMQDVGHVGRRTCKTCRMWNMYNIEHVGRRISRMLKVAPTLKQLFNQWSGYLGRNGKAKKRLGEKQCVLDRILIYIYMYIYTYAYAYICTVYICRYIYCTLCIKGVCLYPLQTLAVGLMGAEQKRIGLQNQEEGS